MKIYELTYIISPEVTLEEAEAKGKEIESAVQSREGTILGQTNPAARTLSYPIKKHASGFMGVLEFQMEPEKLNELKEAISKDGKIVRHMVIIKEPARYKKERRTRIKPRPEGYPAFQIEQKTEIVAKEEPSFIRASEGKEKVELKDIERKLDEILGE